MPFGRTANSVSVGSISGIITILLAILIAVAGLYSFKNIAESNYKPVLYASLVLLAVIAMFMSFYKFLCIVTIIAAFNFSALLFDPRGPYQGVQPFYMLILRDILLLLLFANWFLRRIVTKVSLPIPPRILKPLAAYCLYILARAVSTMTSPIASIRMLRYLVLYPVVLIFIVPYAFRNKRSIERYLWLFVIIGLIVAAIGIINVKTDFGSTYQIHTGFEETYGTRGRAVSTLANPNNLAAYLAMVIGVAVSLAIEGALKSRLQKLFIALIIGVALTCLFLTFSRGGMLALTLTLMVLFGIRGVKNRRNALLVCLVIVMIAGSLMFFLAMKKRSGSLIDGFQKQKRIDYFVLAVRDMFGNPFEFVFGRGIAAGYEEGQEEDEIGIIKAVNTTKADNLFVRIWRESGTIGLFIFLYLLFAILREIEKIYGYQSDPYLKGGCSAALSAVLCTTMWGIGARSFALFPLGYYVWIFVGLAIAVESIKEAEIAHSVKPDRNLPPEKSQLLRSFTRPQNQDTAKIISSRKEDINGI